MRLTAVFTSVGLVVGSAVAGSRDDAMAKPGSNTVSQASDEPGDLAKLVEEYFRATAPADRLRLAGIVDEACGGDVAAVAGLLPSLRLWSPVSAHSGRSSFESAENGRVSVHWRLPAGYGPGEAHPMIVCMPATDGLAEETLQIAAEALGEAANGFVFICPAVSFPRTFHQSAGGADDVWRLVLEARKAFHTDTDRTFLFGTGGGGESAWMAGMARPDLFAGAIVLASYPRVPYPEQSLAFLLGNLRALPVLSVWRLPESRHAAIRRPDRVRVIAAHNRAIVEFARASSLPVVGVELARGDFGALKPPQDEVGKLLSHRRAAPSKDISHWFRYPAHGRTDWFEQTKFRDEVWEASQLSIMPSPAVDRDEYTAEVIKGKLAYLGGRIEGQVMTLTTRRCARVELLLPVGLVDPGKPILVRCNGRKRYDKLLAPSVRTLLETAFARWEFRRPAVTRLSFSVRTDGEPD